MGSAPALDKHEEKYTYVSDTVPAHGRVRSLTVKKAQGLTIKEGVVINLKGDSGFKPPSKHGLPFVAFTRSRSFALTAFKNLPGWNEFAKGQESNTECTQVKKRSFILRRSIAKMLKQRCEFQNQQQDTMYCCIYCSKYLQKKMVDYTPSLFQFPVRAPLWAPQSNQSLFGAAPSNKFVSSSPLPALPHMQPSRQVAVHQLDQEEADQDLQEEPDDLFQDSTFDYLHEEAPRGMKRRWDDMEEQV